MTTPRLEQPEVARFVRAAEAFRDLVDDRRRFEDQADLRALARSIAELYAAGLELPDVEPDDEDGRPEIEVPDGIRVGSVDGYHEVFDPFVADEPVAASLRDDIEDIYRDVVRGLTLVDDGRVAEAIWTWRFDRDVHWGDHAVDALRALQRLIGVDA